MSRTTLNLDDDLLRRLAEHASYELTLEGWQAEEQPGVDLLDRDNLFDLMDGR